MNDKHKALRKNEKSKKSASKEIRDAFIENDVMSEFTHYVIFFERIFFSLCICFEMEK